MVEGARGGGLKGYGSYLEGAFLGGGGSLKKFFEGFDLRLFWRGSG